MEFLLMPMLGWIVLAVLVGLFAGSRGRSGGAWGLLACLISPLIAFIALAVLPDLAAQERMREERTRAEAREDERAERATKAARAETQRIQGADVALRIEKLRQLQQKGLVNDTEYVARKRKIFDELQGKHLVEPGEDFLSLLVPLVENGTLTRDETERLKAFAFQDAPAAPETNTSAQMPTVTVRQAPCPHCGGMVHPEATTCMHCWAKLSRAAG
jgi:hypothetical protein